MSDGDGRGFGMLSRGVAGTIGACARVQPAGLDRRRGRRLRRDRPGRRPRARPPRRRSSSLTEARTDAPARARGVVAHPAGDGGHVDRCDGVHVEARSHRRARRVFGDPVVVGVDDALGVEVARVPLPGPVPLAAISGADAERTSTIPGRRFHVSSWSAWTKWSITAPGADATNDSSAAAAAPPRQRPQREVAGAERVPERLLDRVLREHGQAEGAAEPGRERRLAAPGEPADQHVHGPSLAPRKLKHVAILGDLGTLARRSRSRRRKVSTTETLGVG